jgi:hypothetical protein
MAKGKNRGTREDKKKPASTPKEKRAQKAAAKKPIKPIP